MSLSREGLHSRPVLVTFCWWLSSIWILEGVTLHFTVHCPSDYDFFWSVSFGGGIVFQQNAQ